ncbi:hypothetical protein QYE76_009779 [Lolium multiflorum]|uniref:DNA/RNA-binding protein Alba-like domain-containing protein n=1 Tax=Lolium multiflorum TaxID=4521 RepID=A0AAD8TU97_LOLMU|nr:hypothetical protein QYE76_009779 [Lolium multiflorum]
MGGQGWSDAGGGGKRKAPLRVGPHSSIRAGEARETPQKLLWTSFSLHTENGLHGGRKLVEIGLIFWASALENGPARHSMRQTAHRPEVLSCSTRIRTQQLETTRAREGHPLVVRPAPESRSDSSSHPIVPDTAINTTTLRPQGSHGRASNPPKRTRAIAAAPFDFFSSSSIVIVTMSGNGAEAGGDAAQRTRAGTNGVGASSNRIQVSNTKKPLFFYVNLAKRYMQQHGEVELSALGMAIATVVTVTEILKNNGFAVETKIRTSTVEIKDEMRGRPIQKAKIEIVLAKSENFDELMATAAAEAAVGVVDGDEQN